MVSDSGPTLRRRELVIAAAGAGVLAAGAGAYALLRSPGASDTVPTTEVANRGCVLQPELTEGPFYLEDVPLRRDVTEGKPGAPLELEFTVQDSDTCDPLEDAIVEIWHSDAAGEYSAFDDPENPTSMRGRQRSDADGRVGFLTVYPGWYPGRAPHIHVKAHVGGDTVHTGQLFFDDAVSAGVYGDPPYVARGAQDTTNTTDGIYAATSGRSDLRLTRRGGGWQGTIDLGIAA